MTSSTTQPHPAAAETEKKRRLELTTTQLGASAGAAVTSAVGASFFGANGTIVGAALGSVISTVAGAVYTRSLENAQEKLREKTVLVRKIQVTARTENPAAVPPELGEVAPGARRQVTGDDGGSETVVVPGEPTEFLGAVAPETRAIPVIGPLTVPTHEDEHDLPEATSTHVVRRKPVLLLIGVALAGFVLALGGITLVEKVIGHPISRNSTGSTSLGSAVSSDTSSGSDDEQQTPSEEVTPTPTSTDESTSDPEETASPTDEASETASPTESATPEPTGQASEEAPGSGSGGTGGGTSGDTSNGAGAVPQPTSGD